MQRYFDRSHLEALAGPFSLLPLLLCPVCRRASLELTHESFEDLESLAARDNEYWEPLWVHGFFYGFLACSRTPCGNKYAVAGRWKVDYKDVPTEDDLEYTEYFSVTYILPAFPLMEYPDGVPAQVREAIAGASQVLLSDASAAANRIRSAIEILLDSQRVRRFQPGSRTKRLTTHDRIEKFEATNPEAAKHLMAMKWIGNIGSHEREILPLPMVLDGMEHFARALELIYDRDEKALERRAALINRQGSRLRPKKATKV
jgi:uncharacterized protein YbaR (Trm112 family)